MNPKMHLPAVCVISAMLTATSTHAAVIVSESFGGNSSTTLADTTADTFDTAITDAGGSATWGGSPSFRTDGSYTNPAGGPPNSVRSARLNLGSYINDSKGKANALFVLSATMTSPELGSMAFGFSTLNFPSLTTSYAQNGIGTLQFNFDDTVELFSTTTSNVALDAGVTNSFPGSRSFSIILDLRNYDAETNNFGALTFSDNVAGVLGTHTLTSAQDFGSIMLSSQVTTTAANFDSIVLTQIPEPSTALLGGLGFLMLFRRRR